MKTTPIPEGRVRHLAECAEIAHRHGHHVAAGRFVMLAVDILDNHRVKRADMWRARLAEVGTV